MKTTVLISLMIAVIAMPAMATEPDIPAGVPNPSCDNGVLKTTDGSVNLSANWTPNNITLEWYDGDTKITPDNSAANTCEYSGGITLPTTTPTKTGYTFVGWRVRPAFDMTTLENASPRGDRMFKGFVDSNNNQFCDINQEGATCDDPRLAFLNEGEWAVSFGDDGTIKGEARCSKTAGETDGLWTNGYYNLLSGNRRTNVDNNLNEEGARYCWCRASGFAEAGSETYQPVASPSWVFRDDDGSAADFCANHCAEVCAYFVRNSEGFRRAIFGI